MHEDLHPGGAPRAGASFILVATQRVAGRHDRQQQRDEGKGSEFSQMKIPINHGSKAYQPERNEPEQPARTLTNAPIVVRFEGVEDQQSDTQK